MPLTDLALFYYLIEHTCPPHDAVCTVLARESNLKLLKYAHEHGCPWDERTCEEAALHVHLDPDVHSGVPEVCAREWLRLESGAGRACRGLQGNEFCEFVKEEEDTQDITLSAAQAPTVDCLLPVRPVPASCSVCSTRTSTAAPGTKKLPDWRRTQLAMSMQW